MLFKSALVTSISGSIGGMTGAHNRSGMYLRARAIPVNPNTVNQQVVRSAMRELASRWVETLTPFEREDWDVYGSLVPLPNSLGTPVEQSGIAAYQRSNIPRIQNAIPLTDIAPTTFNLGTFTDPSNAVVSEALQTLAFDFDNTDAWANEDDSSMIVQISRPQNASINFFKGPYQVAGTVDGDAVTAPTSPASIAVPFSVVTGQKVFFRVRVTRADGRLSGTFLGSIVVVA